MTNVLSSSAKGWESIKNGTFVKDYTYRFLSRDPRTALQKAIDKNASYIKVERKKTFDDGDLQMKIESDDKTVWEPFEIYTASNIINNGHRIEIRELRNGEWVYYKKERNNIVNNTLLGKKFRFVQSNNKEKGAC